MDKIDARKLPLETLEHIRRQAFVLRKQGYTWVHIAEVCGVHVGTVLKWRGVLKRTASIPSSKAGNVVAVMARGEH
ncbi:helix-turn-helix domain-containing protein [Thauera sinica]|uniref:Helix-turn-helix domain-containing protein n=1 Tax=Thauera sinica TaxID=2665146 RepID=A0ABW1ASA3_9RHOO|nr:helix-turn-helix domain-containing protein [Thauera sp. K11]